VDWTLILYIAAALAFVFEAVSLALLPVKWWALGIALLILAQAKL
jgi:hypothetical protein